MNILLFVYGTLKRGLSNHDHLTGDRETLGVSKLICTDGVRGQMFLALPKGEVLNYPILYIPKDEETYDTILGEVWEITPERYERLVQFEQGYYPKPVRTTSNGFKAIAFVGFSFYPKEEALQIYSFPVES